MSKTEADTVAEIVSARSIFNSEDLRSPFMVVPDNHHIEELHDQLIQPARIKANISVGNLDSFIDYVKKFRIPDSTVIFHDPSAAKFSATMDYHIDAENPRWRDHSVTYACKRSREWSIWMDHNNNKFGQEAFADFLEDRAEDVVKPSGAELLEIATKFHIIKKAVFGSALRLQSGEFQFQYNEDNQKGTVEIPEEIEIGIAPFHNGEPYRVKARLRYRLTEGKLIFWYRLVDPNKIVETAFKEMVKAVEASGIDAPMFETYL